MAYLDVIPLATAKNYLRVDDSLTADDADITRMIHAALRHIEKETNILVYQRNVTYLAVNGCAKVYDAPITAVVTPTDYDNDLTERYQNYNNYYYGSDTFDLTLTVGYANPSDVPDELVQVALEMIDIMYYSPEKSYKKDISELSKEVLNDLKRFIL